MHSLAPAELRRLYANARFRRVFFENEALNAVLNSSDLSDQLDVTLESSKIVKLALTWVATTHERCNQINIMPFLCLLSLKEKVQAEGYHAACVQYVTVCISHIIVAQIVAEKEVSQRCALLKRSCQTPCLIYAEIEVSQRCALRQHSFKTLCPAISNVIGTEIEVHQRSALRLHSYKTLRSHRQSWDANARSSRVFI